jgi:peptidoglycan/LPS O-acetylase OafA/YrhL
MNSILRFVIATGIWFLITGTLGCYLRRKARPYNTVIMVIHGIFSIFIIAGVISCIFGLQGITYSKLFLTISVYLIGLAAVVKIISGLFIAFIKNDNPVLIHRIATYLMIISLIAGIIFQLIKI